MIFNVIVYKVVAVSIGVFAATFRLLASDVNQLVRGKPAIVEHVWTVDDLAKMARTSKLEAAVSRLTYAAYTLGTPHLEIHE